MAGTVHGILDAVSGATYKTQVQSIFTMTWRFWQVMIAQGYATMIANNYGNGGTGWDWYDGANPPGENAWFLVRMNTSTARPGGGTQLGAYYVLTQWAYDDSFGASPGNPGALDGNTGGNGVGIAVAFRTDGGNPWGGTTGSPGSDTKGTPVWIDGGSTLVVVDASCGPSGTFVTNKENMIHFFDRLDHTLGRIHMVGDEDNFMLVRKEYDTGGGGGTYKYIYSCGLFEPFSTFACGYPLVVLSDWHVPYTINQWYGTLTGGGYGGQDYNGAIVGPDAVNNAVGTVRVERVPGAWSSSTSYSPNGKFASPTWDEVPIVLHMDDYINDHGRYTYGVSKWVYEIFNVPFEGVNNTYTRAFVGAGSIWLSMPWGGTLPPGGYVSSRDGRTI
jgi:hypothetical protein